MASKTRHVWRPLVALAGFAVLIHVFFVGPGVSETNTVVIQDGHQHKSRPDYVQFQRSFKERPIARDRKPRVLVWNRYVETEEKVGSLEDLLKSTAGNIGNNVWSFAGSHCIFDRDAVELVDMWPENPNLKREDFDVHMIPVANMLWSIKNHNLSYIKEYDGHLSMVRRMNAILDATDRPAFMYGLGIQGYDSIGKSKAMRHGLGDPYEWSRPTLDYVLHGEYVHMLSTLSRLSPVISVRGAFTQQVLANYGFETEALGCPSLFLNPLPSVGASVERMIENLPDNPRLVVMLPALYDTRYLQFYFELVGRHPDSVIILQGSTDLPFLRKAEAELNMSMPESKLRFFSNYHTWAKFICDYDAVVGARIHGAMIGFNCPVPVLLIPTDLRTNELGMNMRIPVVQPNHTMFQAAGADFGSVRTKALFDTAGFSGAAFDENRRIVATRYMSILQTLGLPPSKAIRNVASS
jgi:hypothetical protein